MVRARFKRRAAAVIGIATSAAILLAGCVGVGGGSQNSGSSGEKFSGEVEWWTVNLKEGFSDYIQGMIDEYEEMHPDVTIKWVDVPNGDRSTKLLAAIAGGKVPDAVNSGSDTTGLFNDSMADLSEYFTQDDFETYLPMLVKPLQDSEGVQKGIPWYNGGGSLAFYRKSIVNQAGFDEANPPQTFDDALKLARAVHEKTGVYGTLLLPYSQVVQSEGIEMVNKDRTEAAFNTPETVALIEKYKSYYDDKSIAPGAVAANEEAPEQTLYNEQLAFMALDTSSNLRFIEENSPQVYEDIFVARGVRGPSGESILQAQQIFQIPAASDNKAAAAEWLKFVTNAENQLAFCKKAAILPSTPATLLDPFFAENTGDTPNDQARQVLVSDYPTLKDGGLGSSNDLNLRQIFDEEIRAVMLGTKTAGEAMSDAEKAWNEEFAKAAK